MTNLLIKLFIKDNDVSNLGTRGKYGMLSSATGIVVNILLSIVKLVIGIIANKNATKIVHTVGIVLNKLKLNK